MDYSKFDFPAYVYREFPKWVKTAEGSVIVQDAEEEARVLATKVEKVVEAVEERVKRAYHRKDQ